MEIKNINIGEYMSIMTITEAYKKDDDLKKYVERITFLFTGEKDIKKKEADKLIDSINLILSEERNELINTFNYNGVEYGIIPDFGDMTAGEYIDLDTYLKDGEKLDKLMSILYRPIVSKDKKGRYAIEKYSGTHNSEEMRGVDHYVIKSALFFFINLGVSLSKASHIYIEKNRRKIVKMEMLAGSSKVRRSNLMRNLVGILCFIPRLVVAFWKSMKSRREEQTNS